MDEKRIRELLATPEGRQELRVWLLAELTDDSVSNARVAGLRTASRLVEGADKLELERLRHEALHG